MTTTTSPTNPGSLRRVMLMSGVVALAVIAIATQASRPPAPTAGGQPSASFLDAYHFDDLATMTATSELVVVGTVKEVRDGRTIGDEFQYLESSLDLEEVFFDRSGSNVADATTITVESIKFGAPYDPAWAREGTRVLAFLVARERAGVFRAVNYQAYFIIDDTGMVVQTTSTQDFLVGDTSWSQFRTSVDDAAGAAVSGEVTAQESEFHEGPVVRHRD